LNLIYSVAVPAGAAALPGVNTAVSAGCALLALAIVLWLRTGWYAPWVSRLLPAIDAGMVFMIVTVGAASVGAQQFASWSVQTWTAAACVLLAASGGLRLDRAAVIVATLAALLAFCGTWWVLEQNPWSMAYVATILIGAGLISHWMARVAARTAQLEIDKLLISHFLPHADPESLVSLLKTPRRLDATILITDLRGYTAIAESLAPATVLELLNTFQARFARVLRRHGGSVDKFMGDGMLGVFGIADTAVGDHASAALNAAEEVTRVLRQINRDRQGAGEPTVEVGISVHSGPVVVGCLGGFARLEVTVLGDTVNIAERLQGLTKEEAPVVVSEATVVRAREAGQCAEILTRMEEIGSRSLRGRRNPIVVYALRSSADSKRTASELGLGGLVSPPTPRRQ
jgi:class 3 adenylate cyclase